MRAAAVRHGAALGLEAEVSTEAALEVGVVHLLTLGTVLDADGYLVGGSGNGGEQQRHHHAQHQQGRRDDLSGASHSVERVSVKFPSRGASPKDLGHWFP